MNINSKSTNVLYHLGLFYERHEDYEKAMLYFDKLIQIDPKFPPVFNAKGMIYDR